MKRQKKKSSHTVNFSKNDRNKRNKPILSKKEMSHKKSKRKHVRKKQQKPSIIKKKKINKNRKKIKRTVFELFCSIFIVTFFVWVSSFYLFSMPNVEGYSMVPTLRNGERVYVNRIKKIKNFDLLYMQNPISGVKEIRRVIGLPGQTVSYENDQLTINQEEKQEKFVYNQILKANKNGQLYTSDFSVFTLTKVDRIPKNKYLVLGDNRLYVTDSREYGLVDKTNIIGVVTMRIFPIHEIEAF